MAVEARRIKCADAKRTAVAHGSDTLTNAEAGLAKVPKQNGGPFALSVYESKADSIDTMALMGYMGHDTTASPVGELQASAYLDRQSCMSPAA